jgi:WD40 repeat protein
VGAVSFSSDGRWLATATLAEARVWEVDRGLLQETFTYGNSSKVTFSLDGRWLATGQADGTVRWWEVRGGRLLGTFIHEDDSDPFNIIADLVVAMAFSPDGRWFGATTHDRKVRVWELNSRRLQYTFSQENPVASVAFSPDGRLLAGGSFNKLLIWDMESGSLHDTLTHDGGVAPVAFSPDGRWLAGGSLKNLLLWELDNHRRYSLLHKDTVGALSFSLTGSRLSVGTHANQIALWELESTLP